MKKKIFWNMPMTKYIVHKIPWVDFVGWIPLFLERSFFGWRRLRPLLIYVLAAWFHPCSLPAHFLDCVFALPTVCIQPEKSKINLTYDRTKKKLTINNQKRASKASSQCLTVYGSFWVLWVVFRYALCQLAKFVTLKTDRRNVSFS